MEMDMDPISRVESSLIKELRKNVSDLKLKGHCDTDIFYLKWLRARDLDMDRAEEMLRKSMLWRKENDIDDIRAWEPKCATIPVDYPIELCGYNKLGCPIAIVPFSHWDLRRGIEAGHAPEMIRYIDQALEFLEDKVREQATEERPVTQVDFIWDMNGLSFWQLASMKTIEVILEVVRRYEANHPEVLHTAYVINASRIFNMLFNMVKPFLSPRTLNKVLIFSSQTSEWIPRIHKHCPKDQLPIYFGGTGRTSLKMYQDDGKSNKYSINIFKDDLKTLNINPGEKVLLNFNVRVPNSILSSKILKVAERPKCWTQDCKKFKLHVPKLDPNEPVGKLKSNLICIGSPLETNQLQWIPVLMLIWEFRTDYYDIKFGVYREGSESDPCVPHRRYPSWFVQIEGEVKCDKPGQYMAEFSNKYSEIRRAKTLRYRFQVLPPRK